MSYVNPAADIDAFLSKGFVGDVFVHWLGQDPSFQRQNKCLLEFVDADTALAAVEKLNRPGELYKGRQLKGVVMDEAMEFGVIKVRLRSLLFTPTSICCFTDML